MKYKVSFLALLLLSLMFMGACGSDTEMAQFKKDVDNFCTAISDLDASINNVDASLENAPDLVLGYLDQLDQEFQKFASLNFPEDFDYLEPLADEACEYMSTAVANYHIVYADGGFNDEKASYARENSARAFKRIQVILSCLRGESPTGAE